MIRTAGRYLYRSRRAQKAFTLVELLVTLSIIAALTSILVPAVNGVRRKALEIQGSNRLRQVGCQLNVFANDFSDRYPPSIATVGSKDSWTWYDPRRIVGSTQRTPQIYRSMSAYLHDYLDVSALYCPSAPGRNKYLDDLWAAGDQWDNPDTQQTTDPMSGSFCFYWNYDGIVNTDEGSQLFRGPRGPAGHRRDSTLLASDFYGFGGGYDNPPPSTYASCEYFDDASEKSTQIVAPYWSRQTGPTEPSMTLKGTFTDGHVETYKSTDAVGLYVIRSREKNEVFEVGTKDSPGLFYLPTSAVPSLAR